LPTSEKLRIFDAVWNYILAFWLCYWQWYSSQ
jgi:hypothetical protein